MNPASLPDTALVAEARKLLDAAGEPILIDHSLRTFALGRAWGRKHGKQFDEEDLCLVALFHDFGLTPKYRLTTDAFTVEGARVLRGHLEGKVAAARLNAMEEAILFHMQLFPRFSRGDVAGLLQIGAWMDMTGLRKGAIRAEAEEIDKAFPTPLPFSTFNRLLLASFTNVRCCTELLFPPPAP